MPQSEPLVDADALLTLTGELRVLRDRVEGARVPEDQRQRWQRTLGAIAEGATSDLGRATGQLRRFAAQIDRALEPG